MTNVVSIQRFWNKVNIDNLLNCWEWKGSTTGLSGYGQMQWNGRLQVAHRISYQISCGTIPEGMCILHKCDNRLCVNPIHLLPGTRQDNMDDMIRKGRSPNSKGECNPAAKLTHIQVAQIRKLHQAGLSQAAIGRKFKVTRQAIFRIVHCYNWRE